MDLALWLRSLGLEQYEATFRGMARELIAIEDNFQDTLKPAPSMGADDRAGEPVEEAVANVAGELPQ